MASNGDRAQQQAGATSRHARSTSYSGEVSGFLQGPYPTLLQGLAPALRRSRSSTSGRGSMGGGQVLPKTLGRQPVQQVAAAPAAPVASTSGRGSTAGTGTSKSSRQVAAALASTYSAADHRDPQKVAEYAADIIAGSLERENMFRPNPAYMEAQGDLNAKMRGILLDWLIEVHMKYRMRPETLYLTVNIIDRYLSVKTVLRKKLQLLGVVAMQIAAKYEEIDPPRVHEFAYITDKTYTKKEIVDLEARVLAALDFQITAVTPAMFLNKFQSANGCDAMHRSLSEYAMELFLLDLRSLSYPPSLLVCAALHLSNTLLGRPAWPAGLASCVGHNDEATVAVCAGEMREVMEKARTASMQTVRRKFQLEANHRVADMIRA